MAIKRRSTYGQRTSMAAKRARMASSRRTRSVRPTRNVCSFQRKFWYQNWAFQTGSTPGYYRAFQPAFSALPTVGEFINTFDNYRIDRITVTFIPRYAQTSCDAQVAGAGVNNQFYLTLGLDTENALTPSGIYSSTTMNQMLENVNRVRTVMLDKPVTISWRPKVLNSNSVSNNAVWAPFISTLFPLQPHLGLLAFLHDANFAADAASGFSVDVMYDFKFTCRGQR